MRKFTVVVVCLVLAGPAVAETVGEKLGLIRYSVEVPRRKTSLQKLRSAICSRSSRASWRRRKKTPR